MLPASQQRGFKALAAAEQQHALQSSAAGMRDRAGQEGVIDLKSSSVAATGPTERPDSNGGAGQVLGAAQPCTGTTGDKRPVSDGGDSDSDSGGEFSRFVRPPVDSSEADKSPLGANESGRGPTGSGG